MGEQIKTLLLLTLSELIWAYFDVGISILGISILGAQINKKSQPTKNLKPRLNSIVSNETYYSQTPHSDCFWSYCPVPPVPPATATQIIFLN